MSKHEYKTGLEFLDKEHHVDRGKAVQTECTNRVGAKMMPLQAFSAGKMVDDELIQSISSFCFEMYLRGRAEGAAAALLEK